MSFLESIDRAFCVILMECTLEVLALNLNWGLPMHCECRFFQLQL